MFGHFVEKLLRVRVSQRGRTSSDAPGILSIHSFWDRRPWQHMIAVLPHATHLNPHHLRSGFRFQSLQRPIGSKSHVFLLLCECIRLRLKGHSPTTCTNGSVLGLEQAWLHDHSVGRMDFHCPQSQMSFTLLVPPVATKRPRGCVSLPYAFDPIARWDQEPTIQHHKQDITFFFTFVLLEQVFVVLKVPSNTPRPRLKSNSQ